MTTPTETTQKQLNTSRIQRQFWLIQAMKPDTSAYHIVSGFDVAGELDAAKLERCLARMVERHEILRTTFEQRDGGIVQCVRPYLEIEFTDRPVAPAESVDALVREATTRPFDLERGPLARAAILRLSERKSVLLIVMHHIIVDLRSKNLFAGELERLYNGAVDSDGPLPAPAPYADYVAWQENWLKSEAAEKMTAALQKELASQSGLLNLPLDFPRPKAQALRGDAVFFNLGEPFSDALRRFAKQEQQDIFVVLLTAYLVLLQKYARQRDITIGVPLTNRRQAAHKDVLGCFVHILPLCFTPSPESTFRELMKQVRMKMLVAHRNQELPFESILKAVQSKSHPGNNPIYQAGFTVEPPMRLHFEGLEMRPRKIHHEGAQLDVFLSFWDIDDAIQGYFEYDVALFSRETAEQWSRHYATLLATVSRAPDITLGALSPLSDEDRRRLVHALNETTAELPLDTCLHQLVERQAASTPEATAAICGDAQLTYRALDERANRLARYLVGKGLASGSLVGIHLPRSLDMLVSVLAVLKAGGAYVPLDPSFPTNRLDHIAEDSGLHLLVTAQGLDTGLDTGRLQAVFVDAEQVEIDAQPATPLQSGVSPADLAYVLYTSGSTGKPKGIAVHHEAAVNFINAMRKEPGIAPEDALLAVTTLSFDISVLELFLPLSTGARTIIAEHDAVANGEALLDLLRRSGATILQATPSTWQLLLAAGLSGKQDLKILCGGESLTSSLAVQLCGLSDDVWNLYGPTETTVWSTCARVRPGAQVTIGRPIDNTQLYIVDERLQLTPYGVPGELLIGGKGVARGYLNRPDLNAEKFIDDPFALEPGSRAFRTGDLARYRADGDLEHLGRLDYQVKIRGFRIELGEIEDVLSRHPAVNQCAVIVHERNQHDKRLVAYVTLSQALEGDAPKEALRDHLKAELPDYMVPASFQILDEMPLTDNGKIARNRLPEPRFERRSRPALQTTPERETERTLLSVWRALLDTDDIGTKDNFFDVGGTSLLAIEATARIRKALDSELSVAQFFQYPSVETLADFLDSTSDDGRAARVKARAQRRQSAMSRGDRLRRAAR